MLKSRPARWGAVLWLGMHAGVSAAALGATGGVRVPWPSLSSLFAAHAAVSLFFLVFIWPFLLQAAVRAEAGRIRPWRAAGGHLALLAALGAPFALLGARLSGTGAGDALGAVAVLAAAAACAAAVFAGPLAGRPQAAVLYLLAAWTLCAGAPLLGYLLREWAGADALWLAAVSPFRGVVDPSARAAWGPIGAVQAAGYGALAAALAAAVRGAPGAVAGGARGLPPDPSHGK